MKLAVVGSRGIVNIDLSYYIKENVDEIVSGGASGIDSIAAKYAETYNIKFTEILPDYKRYGRGAPIVRNKQIADYADEVVAIWDGKSRGTAFIIDYCRRNNIKCTVHIINTP